MSEVTSSSPAAVPAQDEPLCTAQAFSRFVSGVTRYVGGWLARWCVPAADRDDVLQETLVRAYEKRDTYDPSLGRHVDWAYGIFGFVVRNYRRVKARRAKRVFLAPVDLPDIAADALSPEEETDQVRRRRLLETCLGTLDADSRAIVFARDVDDIPMAEVAIAHGVSLTTAYARYREARARLEAALKREQEQTRALGALVLPIGLDQLLATHREAHDISAETMARIWQTLDRRMAADIAAGKLGDDGTTVERYMGVTRAAPRVGLLGRALRALVDPRVLPIVTGLVGAIGAALITYAIMRASAEPHHETRDEVRTLAPSARAVAPLAAVPSSRAEHEAEPRPGAGSEQPATSARVTAPPDDIHDIHDEQALFDRGSTAYDRHDDQAAIDAFTAHARRYPRGEYTSQRERLLTLALIRAGRTAEARQRIERLRRANPDNPALNELDEALRARN